jgi:hypothetical protein
MGEPTLKALVYGNVWWWARRSAFVHLLYRNLRPVGQMLRPRPERPAIDAAASFGTLQEVFPRNALKMVERTALLLQHEQVDALFVLQPLLILERDRPGASDIERRLFEFNVDAYHPNYEDFMHLAAPFVSESVRSTVQSLGADYLDATGIYSGIQGQIYTDYAHLTPLGNRILAAHIADHVVSVVGAEAVVDAPVDR